MSCDCNIHYIESLIEAAEEILPCSFYEYFNLLPEAQRAILIELQEQGRVDTLIEIFIKLQEFEGVYQ